MAPIEPWSGYMYNKMRMRATTRSKCSRNLSIHPLVENVVIIKLPGFVSICNLIMTEKSSNHFWNDKRDYR